MFKAYFLTKRKIDFTLFPYSYSKVNIKEEKRWLRHDKIDPGMPNLCRRGPSGSNSAVYVSFLSVCNYQLQ